MCVCVCVCVHARARFRKRSVLHVGHYFCVSRSHLENTVLKAEYTRLQESYRELEQMKDSLEDTKATCQLNLTDAQKEAEKTRTEVNPMTFLCLIITDFFGDVHTSE